MISILTRKAGCFSWRRPAFTSCPHHLFLITSLALMLHYNVKSTAKIIVTVSFSEFGTVSTSPYLPSNSLFMLSISKWGNILRIVSSMTMWPCHIIIVGNDRRWRKSRNDKLLPTSGCFDFHPAVTWPCNTFEIVTIQNVKTCQSFPPPPPHWNILKLQSCARPNFHWIR